MNEKIFKQFASLVFGTCVMTAFTSCGKSNSVTNNVKTTEPVEEYRIEGKYEIKFSALNTSVSGNPIAAGKMHIIADQISVQIDVKDSPAMANHSQFIYTGQECPSMIHDTNNDGFIDPQEAAKVLGSKLIALDDGDKQFPWADHMGAYSYYKERILSVLIADLKEVDENPNDEFVKLLPQEDLILDGKVVVIHGVSEDIYLPGSIRSVGMNSDRASLPIACGKISRVKLEEVETGEAEVFYIK